MQLLNKKIFFYTLALFFLSSSLSAMDSNTEVICISLDKLCKTMAVENPLQAQLFPYSVLKKAENPDYTLNGFYTQKLISAALLDSNGCMSQAVRDGVKIWAGTDTKTMLNTFKEAIIKT